MANAALSFVFGPLLVASVEMGPAVARNNNLQLVICNRLSPDYVYTLKKDIPLLELF